MLASYLLKKMRFLTVSSIKEAVFIFCFGYLAYAISELVEMSGIISLLTAGIVMAHYGWFNLSPQGKHVSATSISFMALLAESFVFVYLGLTFFSYASYDWSWQFILVEIIVILVSRFIATVGLVYTLKLFGQ